MASTASSAMSAMNKENTEAPANDAGANPMDQIENIKKMVSGMGINLESVEGLAKMKELATSMGVDPNMLQPEMLNQAKGMMDSFMKK